MKHYKIEVDEKTWDRVSEKAYSLGLSVREGQVVQCEGGAAEKAFLQWLDFCGITWEPVDWQEREIAHAERMAFALRIATLGRKAFGLC